MKLIYSRISLSEFINRNKLFSLIVNSLFNLLFKGIRIICRTLANKSNNVLIISLHRLGDTIFTIPAVHEIRKNFEKRIVIACYPESVPLYKFEFDDIEFCVLDHKDFYFTDRIAKISAKRKLKLLKPEIIFDLIGSMASASLVYDLKAKKTIGMNRPQFQGIYDNYVASRSTPKLIDIYLDVVASVIPGIERNRLEKSNMELNPNGHILIHPFAAWREKEWNFIKYVELALKLKKNFKVNFIFPKGWVSIDIQYELNRLGLQVIETSAVEEMIDEIRECSLFIGNDSGPVNIASFLGRPSFTIYGATNPDYTASENKHQIYIQKLINCSAIQNEKYCPIVIGGTLYKCSGVQCMNDLKVEAVYDKLIPQTERYCEKKK